MSKYEELNQHKLHRLNFFTDAVLAIIMTLLVLELHLPVIEDHRSSRELIAGLKEQLPHFLAFILTFLIMMSAWLGLSSFYSTIQKYSDTLATLVLFLLLGLCLMPYAAILIGNYFYNPVSYLFLGVISTFVSIFQTTAVKHVYLNKMFSPVVNMEYFGKMQKTIFIFPFISIVMTLLAFVNTTLCFVFMVLMQVISIFSVRKYNNKIINKNI